MGANTSSTKDAITEARRGAASEGGVPSLLRWGTWKGPQKKLQIARRKGLGLVHIFVTVLHIINNRNMERYVYMLPQHSQQPTAICMLHCHYHVTNV